MGEVSYLLTHILQSEQCLERIGLQATHVLQNRIWSFWSASPLRTAFMKVVRDGSILPGSLHSDESIVVNN